MPDPLSPRGICIIRVTRAPTGLVLTVTSRSDVTEPSTQSEHHRLDVDDTIRVVRHFLDEFAERRARQG